MIITLKANVSAAGAEALSRALDTAGASFKDVTLEGTRHLVTSAAWKPDRALIEAHAAAIAGVVEMPTEYQLSTRRFREENTVIDLGDGVVFGTDRTVMMAGPCAVESEDQIMRTARRLVETHGIKVFRAGAFKPRTSPYPFQGAEFDGLRILDRVRRELGVKIITEVKDESHLDAVAEHADIIQIGTKSMYHFTLLARCGKIGKPILLKRAFMATLKEFLQAADFILAGGNHRVILCERGIRTFEPSTRFCLDLGSAALLKEMSHLPLVLDPSHAVGISAQVPLVTQASAALEVDGLLVEVHHNPPEARCDREQALSFAQFDALMPRLGAICRAIGRTLV
jgi:3-deoxy-7-phosphoheptulonate synthase